MDTLENAGDDPAAIKLAVPPVTMTADVPPLARFAVPPLTVSGAVTAALRLAVPPPMDSGADTGWLKLVLVPDTYVEPANVQGAFTVVVPPTNCTIPVPVKLVGAFNT